MPEIPSQFPEQRQESPGEEAQRYAGLLVDLGNIFGFRLHQDALAVTVGDVMTWLKERAK